MPDVDFVDAGADDDIAIVVVVAVVCVQLRPLVIPTKLC